ncbi:SDR family oxidoreductase [Pseudonocardia oroxyli]|uniref:SDR family oxidoreductase n=1 Tax=Pseudonocardia oroxyli TaxID=366584 RepID=UPI001FDFD02C|nr:SDR family oxidoreductase [Pseudonocardia oroxyli]
MSEGGYRDERFRDATTRRTPARRWADPAEFERVGAYLADPSPTFHTGDEIVVDGGYCVF